MEEKLTYQSVLRLRFGTDFPIFMAMKFHYGRSFPVLKNELFTLYLAFNLIDLLEITGLLRLSPSSAAWPSGTPPTTRKPSSPKPNFKSPSKS